MAAGTLPITAMPNELKSKKWTTAAASTTASNGAGERGHAFETITRKSNTDIPRMNVGHEN